MRGPKRRRREETSTTGRAKQARSTQPTRSNGGGRNAPKRAAQRPRARSLTTRAQPHTATHPRSRGKGGRSRRVSGRAPCHGKAGVLPSRGGGRKPVGAGGPRKPRPEGNGGDGAPPLAKGAGATHGPHTEEARTTAAILLRRHAGKAGRERAPAIARRGPPSGPPQVHTRSGFARRGEAPSLS